MIVLRRSEGRRHIREVGHNTWMTFDEEEHSEPLSDGFHGLKLFNEEHLAPRKGFLLQTHANMEVVTYVPEGAVTYESSPDMAWDIGTGQFLRVSARDEEKHFVFNSSRTGDARVFQSCIESGVHDHKFDKEQRRFSFADRRGILLLIVSPDGQDGSLSTHLDIRIYSSLIYPGRHLVHELCPGRSAWLHVVDGLIQVADLQLHRGDAAAFTNEAAVTFTALKESEVMLFDLASKPEPAHLTVPS